MGNQFAGIFSALHQLKKALSGTLHTDNTHRILYATDASAYREMPLAVAVPKHDDDLKLLIQFAREHRVGLIPRTAGTSLAGQVVGNGIVVDMSQHFTAILELNVNEGWVRVQPGVVRDELNRFLEPYGYLFGPETSTANRAMIGGMVGNNSCGSNSVVYGSTREHLIRMKALLHDGSEVVFEALEDDAFHAKCEQADTEGKLYKHIRTMLGNYDHQVEIRRQFPKKTIVRRNTGYAIDLLLETSPFTAGTMPFNFCTLMAGSEGTLAIGTEYTLRIEPLPPKETGLLCVHFNTIHESLLGNLIGLQYQPTASELIDHYILDCTKGNIEQSKNRFFVQGEPGAILVIEFKKDTREALEAVAAEVTAALKAEGLGYHYPLLTGADTGKIWALRKAGLGLLGNMPGDDKAVPVIEDTAVDVRDLPAYIREFNEILKQYGLSSVHYAHAGSGELHLRPILNLKTREGHDMFRTIASEIATLVKRYDGSLSGEHGDGRLRGEFIPQMIGEKNYGLIKDLKRTWDPYNIFNPNKIVDTPSMNSMLRYEAGQQTPAFKSFFRYPGHDVLQHAEQCNGSGDCRKTHLSGGTMCPSYMATRDEKDTTRARANILREFLTRSEKTNRFDHEEIKEVMDLCLSCKGCKRECPSNVDVAKLKAEFLQHYYDANGVPLRTRLIANFTASARLGSKMPGLYNMAMTAPGISTLVKKFSGFATARSLPTLHRHTLRAWFDQRKPSSTVANKRVWLFCDEFTNYNDTGIGMKAIALLERLGYAVQIPQHLESGRTWLSKGLLRDAKKIIDSNIQQLAPLVHAEQPLVGIEPSAILSFRDEYPELCDEALQAQASRLAEHCFTIEEFLDCELAAGRIHQGMFTTEARQIKLHGHCQQKALSGTGASARLLALPVNYEVETIPSGCCGMAGSFGYEAEHYDLSMKVGELVLFPAVRGADSDTIIAAPGTSCRHQIKDGTGRHALHPVEVLWEALA